MSNIARRKQSHSTVSQSNNEKSAATVTTRNINNNNNNTHYLNEACSTIIYTISVCVLRGIVKEVVSVATDSTVFALAILVHVEVQKFYKIIPHLPSRVCEGVMNAYSGMELAIILPLHFLASVAGVFFLRFIIPSSEENAFFTKMLEPIIYDEINPWWYDFIREVFVSSILTVAIRVVPELLKLNHISRYMLPLFLIPLYKFSVDHQGLGSTLSPGLLYSLRYIDTKFKFAEDHVPSRESLHIIGTIFGGAIGGLVMINFFPLPDDSD